MDIALHVTGNEILYSSSMWALTIEVCVYVEAMVEHEESLGVVTTTINQRRFI